VREKRVVGGESDRVFANCLGALLNRCCIRAWVGAQTRLGQVAVGQRDCEQVGKRTLSARLQRAHAPATRARVAYDNCFCTQTRKSIAMGMKHKATHARLADQLQVCFAPARVVFPVGNACHTSRDRFARAHKTHCECPPSRAALLGPRRAPCSARRF